jgi:diaminopimelate decarboxylase
LHVYAGSQSLSAEAIIESQRATVALAAEIADEAGLAPPEVNLGGGFGIPYFAGDKPLDVDAVGAALMGALADRALILRDTKFVIELGRWLVGECGVYLTRVVDRKVSRGKTFLVVDGGLHHMLAASGNFGQLLRRNYPVAVAHRFGVEPEEEVTVVGCLCTPLDLLGDEVMLPRAEVGDVIAIFCAGAYGLTASPQAFLSQGAAREVLV